MTEMTEQPIVKFQGKFWVLAEKRGEMLVLMRDGQRAIVPESLNLVTYCKEPITNEKDC